MADPRPARPVLLCIIGDSRCGSTLLQHLLAGQSGVVALGEVRRLERFLAEGRACGCGAAVADCDWWRRTRQRAGLAGRPPKTLQPSGRLQRWLGDFLLLLAWCLGRPRLAAALLPRRMAVARDIAALALAAADGASMVVDSSKDPGHFLTMTLQDRIAVQPVVLLRDGRAVVWSQIRRTGIDFGKAVRHWRRVMWAARLLSRHGPIAPITLRYEEICRNPQDALASLLEVAGLSLGQAAPPQMHAIGGSPDFRPTPLASLRADERWREEMPAALLARFEREAGTMNRRLGAAA